MTRGFHVKKGREKNHIIDGNGTNIEEIHVFI